MISPIKHKSLLINLNLYNVFPQLSILIGCRTSVYPLQLLPRFLHLPLVLSSKSCRPQAVGANMLQGSRRYHIGQRYTWTEVVETAIVFVDHGLERVGPIRCHVAKGRRRNTWLRLQPHL